MVEFNLVDCPVPSGEKAWHRYTCAGAPVLMENGIVLTCISTTPHTFVYTHKCYIVKMCHVWTNTWYYCVSPNWGHHVTTSICMELARHDKQR